MDDLSPTMQKAKYYATIHGGFLKRYPGGYWAREGWPGTREMWFSTPTIQALVSRGVAEYTEWQEHRAGGRFPIKIALVKHEAAAG